MGSRKINFNLLNLGEERKYLLYIMIKRIYRESKKLLIRRNTEKNKRSTPREIKCLPKSHLYLGFPGGSDYLKMISKY